MSPAEQCWIGVFQLKIFSAFIAICWDWKCILCNMGLRVSYHVGSTALTLYSAEQQTYNSKYEWPLLLWSRTLLHARILRCICRLSRFRCCMIRARRGVVVYSLYCSLKAPSFQCKPRNPNHVKK